VRITELTILISGGLTWKCGLLGDVNDTYTSYLDIA